MKITPIEIKQKTFAGKTFGGYDKEEVHAFLLLLSQEWEKKLDHNKELQIKVDLLEKEIEKLKQVESSLFRTLKTAEDTSANIVDQARKTAELKVREAQIKVDVMLSDARDQAKSIVERSHKRSRDILQELVENIKKKEQEYQEIQRERDNFLLEFKSFMNQYLEKAARYESKVPSKLFDEKRKEAEIFLEEKHGFIDQQEIINQQEANRSNQEKNQSEAENNTNASQTDEVEAKGQESSFFDDLNS